MKEKFRRILNIDYGLVNSMYWAYDAFVVTFASTFLLDRGFSNARIGFMFTLGSVISLLLQPAMADLIDHSRRFHVHRMFELAALCMTILSALLMTPSLTGFRLLIVYTLIYALVMCVQGPLNALAFKLEESGLPINYGLCRALASMVFCVIMLVMGTAVERLGTRILPICSVASASLTVVLLLIEEIHFNKAKRLYRAGEWESMTIQEKREEPEPVSLREFFRNNKMFLALCVGVLLIHFSNSVINNFMIQVVRSVGGDNGTLGRAYAILTIMEVPPLVLFNRLKKKWRVTTLLKIGAVGFILRIGLMAAGNSVAWIYLGCFMECVSFGLFMPAMVHFINEVMTEGEAVKGQSFYIMTTTFSVIICSYLAGVILDVSGAKMLLWLSTLLAAAGALVICLLAGRVPNRSGNRTPYYDVPER